MIGNALIGLSGECANQAISGTLGDEKSAEKLVKATVAGLVSGAVGGNGMRHTSSNYYKAAQYAKGTAEKVFSKTYSNPRTAQKLINSAAKMVRAVGRKDSIITGVKFTVGTVISQFIVR